MSWIGRVLQKGLISKVTANNKFYDAVYGFLANNIKLFKDKSSSDYVKHGYEGNADVFSIVTYIAKKFARIPQQAKKGEKDSELNPLSDFFNSVMTDETLYEHRYRWCISNLLFGESLVYYPKLQAGNNEGKLMKFQVMPPQDVDINFGSPYNPIKNYVIKSQDDRPIDPKDVWHTRLYPNMDYTEGKNFRGLSPIKVAAMIISAQNAGYSITAETFERGMPLGILTKIEETYNKQLAKDQKKNLEQQWDRQSRRNLPLFTLGKIDWIKLSYDTLKDLQIIESNQNGFIVLCRLWHLPPQVIGADVASTYNNVLEMKKEMYDACILPMDELYNQGVNKILKPIYDITYESDYSKIEALQKNKKEIIDVLTIANKDNKITGNEYRIALGMEPFEGVAEFELEGLIERINMPQQTFNFRQDE